MSSTPSWMLVVSPSKGEFRKAEGVGVESILAPGAPIGTVANLRDTTTVASTGGGTVTEWLVEDGDPVSPGQPLLRLYPAQDSSGADA